VADVVRLAIIYDTSQAATALVQLNQRGTQLTKTVTTLNQVTAISGSRLQHVARAGVTLASGLASGTISARSLAGALSTMAGAGIAGAVIISVLNIVNAIKEFKRISKDVDDTIDSIQGTARDAHDAVARLLGEQDEESPAEKAIKRLRDAVGAMRKEAARIGGAAGGEIGRQADLLEQEIGTIGARAAKIPAREAAKSLADFNNQLRANRRLLDILNVGPLEQMQRTIPIITKRLQELIDKGQGGGSEAKDLAIQLQQANIQMARMQRNAQRLEQGLNITADAIEDFAVRGTLAFEDFLNNILRLLYRDVASDLIGGILRRAAGSVGGGEVDVGQPILGDPGSGGPNGSVTANVNFNISTIDQQGVSQWVQQNGPQIATEVTRQMARSQAMRRMTRR
jgi:hypothetical protein